MLKQTKKKLYLNHHILILSKFLPRGINAAIHLLLFLKNSQIILGCISICVGIRNPPPKSSFSFSFHKITISCNRILDFTPAFIFWAWYIWFCEDRRCQVLCFSASQPAAMHMNHVERLLKHRFLVTTPEILIQNI